MSLLGLRHPFFLPRWRRVATVAATVAATLGWAVVELAAGAPFWAVLFAALGAYAAWEFFVAFEPQTIRRSADEPCQETSRHGRQGP